mgnify:CR=1 FL=1
MVLKLHSNIKSSPNGTSKQPIPLLSLKLPKVKTKAMHLSQQPNIYSI